MKKMLRRYVSLFLCFAVLLGCFAGCAPAAESDAEPSSAPTRAAPKPTAAPEPDFISRAEWIEQLVTTVAGDEYDPSKSAGLAPYFADVAGDNPQYAFIQTAAMMEWLDAEMADGAFKPDEPATRAFVATTVVNASGYILVDGEDEPSEEILQSDDPLALLFARRLGVIAEDESGSLRPDETVDEAMCETVLTWCADMYEPEEERESVIELLDGVSDLTKTELVYTVDAEGLLHLPSDFGEEPEIGSVLLLPATEAAPGGTAAKIIGGTLAEGFLFEKPAIEEIFESIDLRFEEEFELAGEAQLSASPADETPLPPDTGEGAQNVSGSDAPETADESETDAPDVDEGETDAAETQTSSTFELVPTEAPERWATETWPYSNYFGISVPFGKAGLAVNKITTTVSVRYGNLSDLGVPEKIGFISLPTVTIPLAVRCWFDFDLAFDIEMSASAKVLDLKKDYEKSLSVGDTELISLTPAFSVVGEVEGSGSISIPMIGTSDFAVGSGIAFQKPNIHLAKPNVQVKGRISGKVTFTLAIDIQVLDVDFLKKSYTFEVEVAQELENDDYGTCETLKATVAHQYSMDLLSGFIGDTIDKVIGKIDDLLSYVILDDTRSTIVKEMRRFRDILVNEELQRHIPEEMTPVPLHEQHFEGKSIESLRETPNAVCTRDFTLEMLEPQTLEVGKTAAISAYAKPQPGTERTGITGRIRAESLDTSILTVSGEASLTGVKEGEATVKLTWVFEDENGEWDSLLIAEHPVKVVMVANGLTLTLVVEDHLHNGERGFNFDIDTNYNAYISITGTAEVSGTYRCSITRTTYDYLTDPVTTRTDTSYNYDDGTPEYEGLGEGAHVNVGETFYGTLEHSWITYEGGCGQYGPCKWEFSYEFIPDDPGIPGTSGGNSVKFPWESSIYGTIVP